MIRPRALRPAIAGIGLLVLCALIAAEHHQPRSGLGAEQIAPQGFSEVQALAGADATGSLLLDLVEPADGEGGSEAELSALLRSFGLPAEPAGYYSEGEHLYRVHGDADQLIRLQAQLATHPLVEGVEPELEYSLLDTEQPAARPRVDPNDPMFPLQWHMEMIRAPEAWSVTRGAGVIVAVIDTGVAWKNVDGVAQQVPDLAGTAFTQGKSFVPGLPDGLDDHLHGTHVAGTIAQTTNNGVGVAGVAYEATIMPLKVLGGDGRGSVAGIANAIRYAADNGAQVINMSLGGPLPSRVLAKAIEYANERGVTVVCAAGNESKSRIGYPAANDGSIAVAAVDLLGERTWYSNWGDNLDISAPGGDTRADKNRDGYPDGVLQNTIKLQDPLADHYMWLQGTSMASPHVAGAAALVVARGVTNPSEVERVLKDTAVHPKKVKWDRDYGAGVIDTAAAVDAVTEGYAVERGALAGLLGLAGIAGLGAGGAALGLTVAARRRRQLRLLAGVGVGALLAGGLFGCAAPTALGLASMLGGGAWFGSPWLFSALLPFLLVAVLLGVRPLRGLLTGFALGHSALLLHGAIVLPALLTGLPGGALVDRLWLLANALLTLWLARRVAART
ncbi:MAG: S8 family serine peptidase [Nannocystis sp.]|nr:S8 family serine peptidase [Nannocystis sp.]